MIYLINKIQKYDNIFGFIANHRILDCWLIVEFYRILSDF